MIRLLIGTAIQLVSNALGLLVAAQLLDDLTLTASAFVVAVLVFTVVYAIAQPFLTMMAISHIPALRGGVALVATLVGLLVTVWATDGLSIEGGTTWFAATVIVWFVSLLGVLLLPLIFLKKRKEENRR